MAVAEILAYHMLWTLCKGSLVTQHHNEMRSILVDWAALVYRDVIHEPIVQEGGDGVLAFIADLGIRGVWFPQMEALFDVRVTEGNAPFYMSRSFCY